MGSMKNKMPENDGESLVWRAFLNNLPSQYVVYNSQTIKGLQYDFCVLAPNQGLYMIEVKGWSPSYIINVAESDEIMLKSGPVGSPLNQARGYRFAMVNYLKDRLGADPLVMNMVCYPLITREQYYELNLNYVSDEETTILKEDLENKDRLVLKLNERYKLDKVLRHDILTPKLTALIRNEFEPGYNLQEEEELLNPGYSRLRIIPDELSDEKVKEIINEYFNGIKEIIFTAKRSNLISLVTELEERYTSENIYSVDNKLLIGKHEFNIESVGKSFRAFNFEIYTSQEIAVLCRDTILIEEGKCTKEQDNLLSMLSELTGFNIEQYRVEHSPTDNDVLVMAGAGTGKTFSMVSRVCFLCNKAANSMVDIISDLAMITFTNDAADNMKVRLKQAFMNYFILTKKEKYLHLIEDINQVQISTIHKFALSILRRSCMRIGVGAQFSISSETYQKHQIYKKYINSYLDNVLEENPHFLEQIQMPFYMLEETLIDFSDQLHNKSIDVKNLSEEQIGKSVDSTIDFNDIIERVVVPAEQEYSQWLSGNNLISLSQCMVLLNQMVHTKNLEKYGFNYRYIFVDEFQDTDDVQIETLLILQKMFGDQCKLFIVGDIKQSIYRFRGASVSAFHKIRKESENWEKYSLVRNYRTDRRLLEKYHKRFSTMGAASLLPYDDGDKLISPIIKQYENDELYKVVETDKSHFYDDLFEEIKYQKEKLMKLDQTRLSENEKTIAILVRSNYQIRNILKNAADKVYIEVSTGGDLYRRQSSIDLFILTQALIHSEDAPYLMNLIQSNYVGIKMSVTQLHGNPGKKKVNELIKVLDVYFTDIMHKKWRQIVEDFQTRPVLVVIRDIYESTKPWKNYSHKDDEKIEYQNNYHYLLEIITNKYSRDFQTLNMINDFLEINITTFQEHNSRTKEANESGIRVICTTIHASKGLEYGTVILPFTNNNISSLKNEGLTVNTYGKKVGYKYITKNLSVRNEYFNEVEEMNETACEEMRILYVAMTRAIRNFVWLKDINTGINTWGSYLEEDE